MNTRSKTRNAYDNSHVACEYKNSTKGTPPRVIVNNERFSTGRDKNGVHTLRKNGLFQSNEQMVGLHKTTSLCPLYASSYEAGERI